MMKKYKSIKNNTYAQEGLYTINSSEIQYIYI